MSKIVFENSKGKTVIINKLTFPEAVNERVHNAIASGVFEGFLPVSVKAKRKETQVECVAQGLMPLRQYFSGIVNRKMFLDFVHEIALLIKNCEKNMINANNLDLQSDRVFIDPQTKRVKCVYWPIVNNQKENPPFVFLRNLPCELKFNPYEDIDYLEEYKTFFSGVNPFSVNNFDRMILRLLGKKSSNGHSTPSEALVGVAPVVAQVKADVGGAAQSSGIEYNPFEVPEEPKHEVLEQKEVADSFKAEQVRLMGVDEKPIPSFCFCVFCGHKNELNANFCVNCGKALVKTQAPKVEEAKEQDAKIEIEIKDEVKAEIETIEPSEDVIPSVIQETGGTTVLGDDFGGTTVLGYEEVEEPARAFLKRVDNDEKTLIAGTEFILGSDPNNCDYAIIGNKYISRKHAKIIVRDERYYIVDCKSTNKTYVDGKVIPAETEVELFDITQIRLANADFVFIIEE